MKVLWFPTIKLFHDGQTCDYHGDRTKSHILEFIDRKTKRPLRNVNTVEEVEALQKEYEWIGILNGATDSDRMAVQEAAFNINNTLFLSTSSGDIVRKYGVESSIF